MANSELENLFLFQVRAVQLPTPEHEFRFHPSRKWRFDFAWPDRMVYVEVEGGVFVKGRHSRGAGFRKDCEKYNAAAILGWTGLRVIGDHVHDGRALVWLERLFAATGSGKLAPGRADDQAGG